jgi:hypothetical protein
MSALIQCLAYSPSISFPPLAFSSKLPHVPLRLNALAPGDTEMAARNGFIPRFDGTELPTHFRNNPIPKHWWKRDRPILCGTSLKPKATLDTYYLWSAQINQSIYLNPWDDISKSQYTRLIDYHITQFMHRPIKTWNGKYGQEEIMVAATITPRINFNHNRSTLQFGHVSFHKPNTWN